MSKQFHVVVSPKPFQHVKLEADYDAGLSVQHLIDGYKVPAYVGAVVCVDGVPVGPEGWDLVLTEDQLVVINIVPVGDGAKEVFTLVAIIAISVAAPELAALAKLGAVPTAALTAAITIAGTLIVRAIAPPPSQGGLTPAISQSQALSITGIRNSLQPYATIPKVLGTHKIFPPLGGPNLRFASGGNLGINSLFLMMGHISFSSIKIGDVNIDEIDGVDYSTRAGDGSSSLTTPYYWNASDDTFNFTLIDSNDGNWTTSGSGAEVNGPGEWFMKTTELNTVSIMVDFYFPGGHLAQTTKGNAGRRSEIEIEISVSGADSWSDANVTNGSNPVVIQLPPGRSMFVSYIVLPASTGQWDIRCRATGTSSGMKAPSEIVAVSDKATWIGMKSFLAGSKLTNMNIASLSLRAIDSQQLSGVIDQLNFIATSLVADWNGAAWVADQPSSNPASLVKHVLQDSVGNASTVLDADIDLTQLQTWHAFCVTNGLTYNRIIDGGRPLYEVVKDICAAGWASPTWVDGKFTVIIDQVQSTPVQMFTPRNSFGFKGTKDFLRLPHAIKARFIDADQDYRQNEILVYDDGYAAGNSTLFETIEYLGITSASLVWKHARFHIATARLRPEIFELNTDTEYIVATRGDLVTVTHDVPLLGLNSGRIKALVGDVTGITVDEVITMESGKTYGAVWRRTSDGVQNSQAVTLSVGTSTTLSFTATVSANKPVVGDLFVFGELATETSNYLVHSVIPDQNLGAKLILIPYIAAMYTSFTGTIPSYDFNITVPPSLNAIRPPKPIIQNIVSDETVLVDGGGIAIPQIQITLQPVKNIDGGTTDDLAVLDNLVTIVYMRINASTDGSATGEWELVASAPEQQNNIFVQGVNDLWFYDLRIYHETAGDNPGHRSEGTEVIGHKVLGRSDLPKDVPQLFINKHTVTWDYPDPPIDVELGGGFRVKWHEGDNKSWSDAIEFHNRLVHSPFVIEHAGTGERTIMVKAVDSAGNESLNATVASTVFGDRFVGNVFSGNLITTKDYDADSFPGTITNGTLSGGDLIADTDASPVFWKSDILPFWIDDNEDFWGGTTYQEMTYQFEYQVQTDETDARLFLDTTVTGNGIRITYQPRSFGEFWTQDANAFWESDTDAFWESAEGAFTNWPGNLFPTLPVHDFKFRIITDPGNTRGVIDQVAVKLDVPDLIEVATEQTILAGGSSIALSNTYRAITNASFVIRDDGGTAIGVRYTPAIPSTLAVRAYDKDNVGVAATIDATIQGY